MSVYVLWPHCITSQDKCSIAGHYGIISHWPRGHCGCAPGPKLDGAETPVSFIVILYLRNVLRPSSGSNLMRNRFGGSWNSAAAQSIGYKTAVNWVHFVVRDPWVSWVLIYWINDVVNISGNSWLRRPWMKWIMSNRLCSLIPALQRDSWLMASSACCRGELTGMASYGPGQSSW